MTWLLLILENQKIISRLLLVYQLVWLLIVCIAYFLPFSWRILSKLNANLAVFFLLLTFLPGLINRMQLTGQWWGNLAIVLRKWRRQLGMISFEHGFWHFVFIRLFFVFAGYRDLVTHWWSLSDIEQSGVLTIVFGLLPFLTSNDWSLKKLSGYWHKLQKLSYLFLLGLWWHLWQIEDKELSFWLISLLVFLQFVSYLLVVKRQLLTSCS